MSLNARGSPANYQRQRTQTVGSLDLDALVLSYSQHDSSALTYLGKHSLETRWKVVVGALLTPIDIVVTVDKMVAGSSEVRVEIDGQTVREKAKLEEDFLWDIPFRGLVKGIGRKGLYEIRPAAMSREMWLKATVTRQCDGGWFWATAEMPNGNGGIKEVHFPAITAENIREAHGLKRPLLLPKRSLTLCVPKNEPMHATLAAEDGDLLTHSFGRYTPAPSVSMKDTTWLRSVKSPSVKLVVSKDHNHVTTEVGHAFLSQFVGGEVYGVSQQTPSALQHSWTIRIGPSADHTVQVQKTSKSSKSVSLLVDGDLLVESTAEDLESPDGQWVCQFRFVGQRYLEWEVYESDSDGNSLDTTSTVRQPFATSVLCTVYFEESVHDLRTARLHIDQTDFTELPFHPVGVAEAGLCLKPEALMACYSLNVPYRFSNEVASQTPLDFMTAGFSGLLRCCYGHSTEPRSDAIEILTKGDTSIAPTACLASEHEQPLLESRTKRER